MGKVYEYDRLFKGGDCMRGDLRIDDGAVLQFTDGTGPGATVIGQIRRNGNDLEFRDVTTGAWVSLSAAVEDHLVKGDAADTTPSDLENKTAQGTGISVAVSGSPANSILNIALANGAANGVRGFDNAGAPHVVPAGVATHVLTANAGAPPTFQVMPGGGGTIGLPGNCPFSMGVTTVAIITTVVMNTLVVSLGQKFRVEGHWETHGGGASGGFICSISVTNNAPWQYFVVGAGWSSWGGPTAVNGLYVGGNIVALTAAAAAHHFQLNFGGGTFTLEFVNGAAVTIYLNSWFDRIA